MNYPNGEFVQLGDLIFADGSQGVVVSIISEDKFSQGFPEEEWRYLGEGILVNFIEMGLVHFATMQDDFRLISRNCEDTS